MERRFLVTSTVTVFVFCIGGNWLSGVHTMVRVWVPTDLKSLILMETSVFSPAGMFIPFLEATSFLLSSRTTTSMTNEPPFWLSTPKVSVPPFMLSNSK